jgi:hypothetical protein
LVVHQFLGITGLNPFALKPIYYFNAWAFLLTLKLGALVLCDMALFRLKLGNGRTGGWKGLGERERRAANVIFMILILSHVK